MALTLLADRPASHAAVIGVASVVDADDLPGRAVELSRLLSLHHSTQTLLLEADLRRPSRLAAAMEMDPGPGLLEAIRAPDRADEAVRPTPDPRLWVMTAGAGLPSSAPLGSADFGDLVDTLREGAWAVGRRVLDIRSDAEQEPAREAARTLVSAGGGQDVDPHDELRPFNEGPIPDPRGQLDTDGMPPLPPLPARRSSDGSPAVRSPRPVRTPTIVMMVPPFEAGVDADVVAAPCDQVILLVHTGRTSREQVADAAARVGRGRLIGTVVVPPSRRRG